MLRTSTVLRARPAAADGSIGRGRLPAAWSPSSARGRLAPAAAAVLLGWLVCGPAAAAGDLGAGKPDWLQDEYSVDVWQAEDGLPGNSVTSIVQTFDGYLWFGTLNGLVRFDGVRFKVMPVDPPDLESQRVVQLFVDHRGALWVAMEYGQLARYAGGQFTSFHAEDGWPGAWGRSFGEDAGKHLLVCSAEAELFRFQDGRFTQLLPAETGPEAYRSFLVTDPAGVAWIRRGNRLGTLRGNRWVPFQPDDGQEPLSVDGLGISRTDGIWVRTGKHIRQFMNGRWARQYPIAPGTLTTTIKFMEEDSAGRLWIGTWGGGLTRLTPEGEASHFSTRNGLPHDTLRCLFEDREGNLWLGTDGAGLVRLKRRIFHSMEARQGLPTDGLAILAQDDRSHHLIGALKHQVFELIDQRWSEAPPVPGIEPGDAIFAILQDRRGRRWLGTYGKGVFVRDGNVWAQWSTATGLVHRDVLALFEDRDGAIWIGTEGGLSRLADGQFQNYTTSDGLPVNMVRALAQDRDGRLWIGTTGGGLTRWQNGQFTTFTKKDGLPHLAIRSLLADADGSLWIGTSGGGLTWLRDGRFVNFTKANGLPDGVIAVILDDDLGNLWMGSNHGVFRVSRSDLEAFAEGARPRIDGSVYLRSEGLASAHVSTLGVAGLKGQDGRLWFATSRGVSVVNPRQLQSNLVPPRVRIEEVLVDDVLREPSPQGLDPLLAPGLPTLKIHAGATRTEFHYTALSLTSAERNRFRFRLEGYDPSWIEAGQRRVAYYTKVPPGSYRFQVRAANSDGVWNEAGASLAVVFQAQWWQTWGARAALALALAGGAGGVYLARLRALTRAGALQSRFSLRLIASQEAERKRIAHELHDSLGQNLLVIKNRVALAQQQSSQPEKLAAQLREASATASEAIREIREISQNLRPFQIDELGLTKALATMVRKIDESSLVQFTTDIADLDGAFPTEQEIHFYRIIQECLNNVLKHAHATQCRVVVSRDDDGVHASVSDNGRGFAATERQHEAVTGRSLGLAGIAERVRLLGGQVQIVARPGEGTSVIVTVPPQP